MSRSLVYIALVFLLSSQVHAFWILSHSSLTQDRLDPIISPGAVASHVHTIVGSSAFGPNISFESLRADKNCTTSPVQADMSNYWAPQLYRQNHENNTYTLVPISFVNTYYLQRTGPTQTNVTGFPAGLRMLAGSATRICYNASSQADRAINFICLSYNNSTAPSSTTNEFPDYACPDGLRAQAVFPSCWNGKNLDSEDHKSHLAYPLGSAPDSGDCPESHPVKLITLFHEWIFDTGKFEFVSGVKNWVLSTGDETGLTFYADFVNGWDTDVLQAAVEQCTSNLFGNVEQCPPFVASIDKTRASSCAIPRVVEEDIDGPLTVLPGCIPVPFTGAMSKCTNLTTHAIKGLSPGSGGGNGNATSSSGISGSSTIPSSSVTASGHGPVASASGSVAPSGNSATTRSHSIIKRRTSRRRHRNSHRRRQDLSGSLNLLHL